MYLETLEILGAKIGSGIGRNENEGLKVGSLFLFFSFSFFGLGNWWVVTGTAVDKNTDSARTVLEKKNGWII